MAGMRTEMVKQALVRYIADKRLFPENKLPSQNELRLKLNVGSATISSAIKSLAEDGVLEIRDKVGVFIKESGLDGHTGRNVAILVNVSNSIYNHIAVSQLQKYLQNENCHNMVFSCPGDKDSKSLRNYPGLIRNIKQKHISAILVTCELFDSEYRFMDQSKIKYVSTLEISNAYNCCHIDFQKYVNEAFAYLVEHGAKRPAIISLGYEINQSLAKPFRKNLEKLNTNLDYRDFFIMTHSFADSRKAVENLLSKKPNERPDALIFTGDVVMQGVSVWMLRLQAGVKDKYLPIATAMLNKQNPIMPVLEDLAIFELDICEQARVAVDALLDGTRNNTKIISRKIPARLASLGEYCMNSIAPEKIIEQFH